MTEGHEAGVHKHPHHTPLPWVRCTVGIQLQSTQSDDVSSDRPQCHVIGSLHPWHTCLGPVSREEHVIERPCVLCRMGAGQRNISSGGVSVSYGANNIVASTSCLFASSVAAAGAASMLPPPLLWLLPLFPHAPAHQIMLAASPPVPPAPSPQMLLLPPPLWLLPLFSSLSLLPPPL